MELKKAESGYVPFKHPPRKQRRQLCSPSSAESWQVKRSVLRSDYQQGQTYRASRHHNDLQGNQRSTIPRLKRPPRPTKKPPGPIQKLSKPPAPIQTVPTRPPRPTEKPSHRPHKNTTPTAKALHKINNVPCNIAQYQQTRLTAALQKPNLMTRCAVVFRLLGKFVVVFRLQQREIRGRFPAPREIRGRFPAPGKG
jgi:hypothetical protein